MTTVPDPQPVHPSSADRPSSAPRPLRRAAAWLVFAAAVAGCGIPLDETPRAVQVTTTTSVDDGASSSTVGGDTVYLYFLQDNALTAIATEGSAYDPNQVLAALFAGAPQSAGSNVSSQIPSGVRLLDVDVDNGTITIDVSSEFDNLVGQGRTLALAQIVMTLTGLPDIDSVSMRVEGSDVPMYSPETGDSAAVRDCDYRSLLPDTVGGMRPSPASPTVAELVPPGDSPDVSTTSVGPDELDVAERHLLDRIVELSRRCDGE